MTKRKGIVQKISLISAVACFGLALASVVMLFLQLDSVASDKITSASWLTSALFFISVGAVLVFLGKVDLPSFKVNNVKDK